MTAEEMVIIRLCDFLRDWVQKVDSYEGDGGISLWADLEGYEWYAEVKKLLEEMRPY